LPSFREHRLPPLRGSDGGCRAGLTPACKSGPCAAASSCKRPGLETPLRSTPRSEGAGGGSQTSSTLSIASTGRSPGKVAPRATAGHRRSRHRDAIDEIGRPPPPPRAPRVSRRCKRGRARLGRLGRLRRLRRPAAARGESSPSGRPSEDDGTTRRQDDGRRLLGPSGMRGTISRRPVGPSSRRPPRAAKPRAPGRCGRGGVLNPATPCEAARFRVRIGGPASLFSMSASRAPADAPSSPSHLFPSPRVTNH
jgi:hypothetical protein